MLLVARKAMFMLVCLNRLDTLCISGCDKWMWSIFCCCVCVVNVYCIFVVSLFLRLLCAPCWQIIFLINKLYYWLLGNMQYIFLHLLLCMIRVDERMLWRGCLLRLTWMHVGAVYNWGISQAFSPPFNVSCFLYRSTVITREESVKKSTGDKQDVSPACDDNKEMPIRFLLPRGTRWKWVWFTFRQSFSTEGGGPTLRTARKYELLNTLGGEIRNILAVQNTEV